MNPQPLEFRKFSGGITDNFLQGSLERAEKLDNFLLTVDDKAEVRPGTVIYDPSAFSLSLGSRVAGLFTGINETCLFGHSNRDFYTQAPDARYGTAWTRITGPTGNEALGGGTNYSQVTTGDFQRQIYYTSDVGVQPGKLFRDTSNTWKAVTAGLPKLSLAPNYPDNSALIARCILLANKIRASMVSHFKDAAGSYATSTTNQHALVDKWSLSYLETQSWSIADAEYPGPTPTPTAAGAATSESTLYTLCTALALAFEHHRNDIGGATPDASAGARVLHQPIAIYPTGTANPYGSASGISVIKLGLSAKMVLSGVVSSPSKAAAFLDELATKWYWHQLLPFVHSPNNTYSLMARYLLSASGNDANRIGTIYTSKYTLQATPNYGDFVALGYWAKTALNKHGLGTGSSGADTHAQVDPYAVVTLPDPIDYDSTALTLFWARWLYGYAHIYDAEQSFHSRIAFDSVTGSTDLTNVKTTATGAALTLPVNSWVIVDVDYFNDSNPLNRRAARVMASGLGTATLSRTVITGRLSDYGEYSNSWLHGSYILESILDAACDVNTDLTQANEKIQAVGATATNLQGWITLGSEFMQCLANHEANGDLGATPSIHKKSNFIGNDIQGQAPSNSNPFFIPTVVSLAWGAFYRYQYVVEPNGVLYVNEGAPIFSNSIQTCASFPVNTVIAALGSNFNTTTILTENACATLAGIPALVNTSGTNYDTTVSVAPTTSTPGESGYAQNLTIELYRTTNGGTTFYHLESLTNVYRTYSDVTNETYPKGDDVALNLRPVLYTSGGVLANDQPPTAKFIHEFGGSMYYGAITDSGQELGYQLRQSNELAPDSVPATFSDDLEDVLTGLSSTRSNLLALCKNSVYRISGSFTSTGQGGLTHDRISDAQGCLNAKSIVKTEIGVFYAGTDGFYYTDGYQVIKISLELDKTYRSMTESDEQKARIYGAYDKLTRRIWWAMQSNPTSADNDVFFVYYLNYGVKPSGVFTKAFAESSWNPSSHVFFQGKLIIGDSQGYLFKTDSNTKTDPKVVFGDSPSTWNTVYVPYKWRSCAIDCGSSASRKWITKMHVVGQNVGNTAIQVNSINDAGSMPDGTSSSLALAPIQYVKNKVWGDPRVVWGDDSYTWKYDGTMDVWRRFPSRAMRSNFKQIELEPADIVVYRSDDYPDFAFATVDATAKTATLQTPSGFSSLLWPLDVVDYYLSLDTDEYATTYLITAIDVTKKILTVSDPDSTLATSSAAKWQISGVKKEQRVRLTALDINFAPLGDEFEAYPGASDPGGVGNNA